jgi:hypothetical protein
MPLPNGNYVVDSPYWNTSAAMNLGAVTWCDGASGRVETVSSLNSVVGSVAYAGVDCRHSSDQHAVGPAPAEPNRLYYVQRSTNLSAHPLFVTLATNLPGQFGTTLYHDPNAPSAGLVSYRVGVQ